MKRSRRLIAIPLLFTLAHAALAQFPLVVTDDLGREVRLAEAPRRVVSMLASSTEIACALEACDLLVGVDQFSNHPAEVEDLPKLGSAFSPDLEALVALEPDLVLVDEDSGLAAQLEGLGIVSYAGSGQSLAEVLESIETIGTLLGREAQARRLVSGITSEIEGIAQVVAQRERPTVFFELDATPYSVGPGSFIDELISLAGGENVVGDGFAAFPQVDPEFVVAADPDIIVLADAPFGVSAETLAERPGWAGVTAVESGRVAELSQEQVDMLNRPGPRVAEAVAFLARLFHPDAF